MDLARFTDIVGRLKEGQLIEIVQEDPSGHGFFTDPETGAKQLIRQPVYFSARTNISTRELGISVTSNMDYTTGRPQPAYSSISYKSLIDLIVPEIKEPSAS